MNIKQIINEEINEALSSMDRTPFPHVKINDHRYEFRVHLPDHYTNRDGSKRDYDVTYEVTLQPYTRGDEKGYEIAFGDGGYGDTNIGIPLRIMTTVSNAIKDFVTEQNPQILTFTPSRTDGDMRGGEGTNRRLKLYNTFLKAGAGNDYDGFIVGNNERMIVERRDTDFSPVNGEQPASVIQDIIKDLSFYKGVYKTVGIPENDPKYTEYSANRWDGFIRREGGLVEKTLSPRKFVDWLLSEDDVQYSDEATREFETPATPPAPTQMPADAPIQRVGGGSREHGVAPAGTFQHFLNNNVFGQQDYRHIQPFFDGLDTIEKFDELKSKAERQLWTAEEKERERLEDIVMDINKLKRAYDEYQNTHNNTRTLNEIESELENLIK